MKIQDQQTKFNYTDIKGKVYPIYITSIGRCYITKVSSKTKKKYKQYIKEELARIICQELNVEYKNI
jgi:hypothetical protein